jgi:CRP/FNR family transcriptional regulator, cyclic AMP receptor protein
MAGRDCAKYIGAAVVQAATQSVSPESLGMATNSRRAVRVQHRALAVSALNGITIAHHKRDTCIGAAIVFAKLDEEKPLIEFSDRQVIYSQGDAADSVFYIRNGAVKLAVVSPSGKEAVMPILESGSFFGEASLIAGRRPVRLATATSIGRSVVVRFEKQEMIKRLHEDAEFADTFLSYMVARTSRVEADLVDQLFNPTEKRLARILLLLANFGNANGNKSVIPKISQETLAQMVGASRARVSSFLNKFRKRGFIKYNGGLHVHRSLLNVILHD